jgi:hypothetical protein
VPIARPFGGSLVSPPLTSYSTLFPATENPLSEGGMWRVGGVTGYYENPRTVAGTCFAAATVDPAETDDCLGQLQNHSVPVNHRVTATIRRVGGYVASDSHEVGLYLRLVIGAQFVRGYECLFAAPGGGNFQIVRWEGTGTDGSNFAVLTTSGSHGTLVDGDVIAAEIIGTNIKCYKNGVQFESITDATWSNGNPGMGFFVRPGGTPASFCISAWAAQAA